MASPMKKYPGRYRVIERIRNGKRLDWKKFNELEGWSQGLIFMTKIGLKFP
jgi:hypothetical protein